LENAGRRRVALEEASAAAMRAAVLARQRYTAGLASYQTVLDTERTVLAVEDSLKSSEAEGASALIGLYKALGGGWGQPSSSPATTAGGPEATSHLPREVPSIPATTERPSLDRRTAAPTDRPPGALHLASSANAPAVILQPGVATPAVSVAVTPTAASAPSSPTAASALSTPTVEPAPVSPTPASAPADQTNRRE
jgi:hypothetical protein